MEFNGKEMLYMDRIKQLLVIPSELREKGKLIFIDGKGVVTSWNETQIYNFLQSKCFKIDILIWKFGFLMKKLDNKNKTVLS